MGISHHSLLTGGLVAVTATAIVATPLHPVSSMESAAVSIPVLATAAINPLAFHPLVTVSPLGADSAIEVDPGLLAIVDAIEKGEAATGGQGTDDTPPVLPRAADVGTLSVASDINSTVKSVYNWGEAWVQWGVDVATWAVGWVPLVGWFAGQIPILYDFGEAIVRSIVFNVTDWVTGYTSFAQGLNDVIDDTVGAVRQLVRDEINWAFGWVPPLPPIFPSQAQTVSALAAVETGADTLSDEAVESPRLTGRVLSANLTERFDTFRERLAEKLDIKAPNMVQEKDVEAPAEEPAVSDGVAGQSISVQDETPKQTGVAGKPGALLKKLGEPRVFDSSWRAKNRAELQTAKESNAAAGTTDAPVVGKGADDKSAGISETGTSSTKNTGEAPRKQFEPKTKIGKEIKKAGDSVKKAFAKNRESTTSSE